MIGAKSVPAFPKKYSTPRAARSSRYASAVLSMFARLVMGGSPSSLQVKSQHPQRVALVDHGLGFGGGPHPLHGGDGPPDEPRPLLGILRQDVREDVDLHGAGRTALGSARVAPARSTRTRARPARKPAISAAIQAPRVGSTRRRRPAVSAHARLNH